MSNSSQRQTLTRRAGASPANVGERFSAIQMTSGPVSNAPGDYDDAASVRSILIQTIKRSGLSREQIAERMTYLLGRPVTERMLYGFTAEGREDRRWPAEFDRAFCEVTGDNTLLLDCAKKAGLIVISEADYALLELGRAYREKKRAVAAMEQLEREMEGGQR